MRSVEENERGDDVEVDPPKQSVHPASSKSIANANEYRLLVLCDLQLTAY